MDFKKIENIFLVAFLLLNVYLLIGYLNRYDIQYATTAPNQVNLVREMEQSGINLPAFNESEPTVYSMQANRHSLLEERMDELEGQAGSTAEDGSYYMSLLSDPLELEGSPEEGFTEEDEINIIAFVHSSSVLFGEEYGFANFDSENNRFVFYQQVNGLPVTDGTSEISLYVDSEGNIFSYQQTYAGPMTEQGSPLDLITDLEAVEILFQSNELNANVTVRQPVLSYERALYLEDLSMYRPIWIVHVYGSSGTEVLRVDAMDGSILYEPMIPIDSEEPDPDELEVEEEPEEAEEPIDESEGS